VRVLALDTALGATSVAVVDYPSGTVLARASLPMQRGHAEALMPMIEQAMAGVEGGFGSLSRIGTTVGPGSFTGLRVAVSAARSLGLALAIPVVGVSTLAAYAAPVIASGARSMTAVAIDARHGAVFFESFWLDGKKALGPLVLGLEQAAETLRSGRCRLVGTGAPALHDHARKLGLEADLIETGPAPDILWVARLAAAADPACAPARPLYLKAASAVPQGHGQIARA